MFEIDKDKNELRRMGLPFGNPKRFLNPKMAPYLQKNRTQMQGQQGQNLNSKVSLMDLEKIIE